MPVERPPHETQLITGEELYRLGDIGRCELVDGRIVYMHPTGHPHGSYESNFSHVLRSFVDARRCGKVLVGEVGVYTRRDPDTVRGADVVFISGERHAKIESSSYLDIAPDLIVEILSPDDRWNAVMEKVGEYLKIGVRLIWVADPKLQAVHAYRSLTDVRTFAGNDRLPGDDVLPGFSVDVAELFEA
jgi:Uma2 family endonuclease